MNLLVGIGLFVGGVVLIGIAILVWGVIVSARESGDPNQCDKVLRSLLLWGEAHILISRKLEGVEVYDERDPGNEEGKEDPVI